MKEKLMVIGIDPGTQGGIVVLTRSVDSIRSFPNPKEMDDFRRLMLDLRAEERKVIVFNEHVQQYPGDFNNVGRAMQMNKLFARYSKKVETMEMLGFQVEKITPRVWQKELGLKTKKQKGESDYEYKKRRKDLYKDYARSKYPAIKVKNANADALCLLTFGRMKIQSPEIIKKSKPDIDLF